MTPALFGHVVSIEARRRMSYRVDFWLGALVGFAAELGVFWFVWQSLFAEKALFAENAAASPAGLIGGYDFRGVIVYYVTVLLFARMVRGVEFDNQVSLDVYEGGLNRYLVFPTSYFAFKYAQHIGSLLPALVQLVLFGVVCLLALDPTPDLPSDLPGAGRIAMCLAALALANFLYFLMSFPLQAVSFWADNVWSLVVALRFVTGLMGGLMVPLSLFPGWAQTINDALPFRCLFALPAEALLGSMSVQRWATAMAVGAAWAGILAGVTAWVWRRGRLRYSGIGM